MTRTAPATAEVLGRLGAATIGESGGSAMSSRIRAIWPGAAISAPAFPVSCEPGDNLSIHRAVAEAPSGSVLVVDVGQLTDRGYFGEVLATAALTRGIAGLVIDGCVRDVTALERLNFPVFAHGPSLPGSSKDRGGAIGSVATVGGVLVAAGDWIVADADGIAIVPLDTADDVLAAGEQREHKENRMFEALREGATTIDLLDLDVSPVGTGSRPPDATTAQTTTAPAPRTVNTSAAPVPSGGYSQARWAGDMLYLAGLGPYDPQTREVVGADISSQTAQTLANAERTLEAAGLDLRHVVSTQAYLADLGRDWRGFDAVYGQTMPSPYPARAMVGATLKGILVELVMIADARR